MKRGMLVLLAIAFLAVAPQVMAATTDATAVSQQAQDKNAAVTAGMDADAMNAAQEAVATDKLEKNEKGLQQMMDMMKQKGGM